MSTVTKEFAQDLVDFQSEMQHALKNAKNPHFKSKYADLPTVIDCNRPLLHKYGFAVIQKLHSPSQGEQGVIIETVLIHKTGAQISSSFFMPSTKNDAQGYGSAITYGRRYAYASILGFASDEDDDGNKASEEDAPSTIMQHSQIQALCADNGIDLSAKLLEAGVPTLQHLSFNAANAWIKAITKKFPNKATTP